MQDVQRAGNADGHLFLDAVEDPRVDALRHLSRISVAGGEPLGESDDLAVVHLQERLRLELGKAAPLRSLHGQVTRREGLRRLARDDERIVTEMLSAAIE